MVGELQEVGISGKHVVVIIKLDLLLRTSGNKKLKRAAICSKIEPHLLQRLHSAVLIGRQETEPRAAVRWGEVALSEHPPLRGALAPWAGLSNTAGTGHMQQFQLT